MFSCCSLVFMEVSSSKLGICLSTYQQTLCQRCKPLIFMGLPYLWRLTVGVSAGIPVWMADTCPDFQHIEAGKQTGGGMQCSFRLRLPLSETANA